MNIHYKIVSSPVGKLTLIADEKNLLEVRWENYILPDGKENKNHPVLIETEKQLMEYFSGKRETFQLPLKMQGTEFQIKVWKQLQRIPFAKTSTYGELAQKIGNMKASRAVGAANGKNPLSIIVPCHRVIGKSGDLRGFAGGLKNKAFLLTLESKN